MKNTSKARRAKHPGSLDRNFGENGKLVLTPLPPRNEQFKVQGLSISENNELLLAGSYQKRLSTHMQYFFLLMRRTTEGQPDPTFGLGGEVEGPFDPTEPRWTSYGLKIFEPSQSSILLMGACINQSATPIPALAKFSLNGTPDGNYGNNGTYVFNAPPMPEIGLDRAHTVSAAMQSDERVVMLHRHQIEIRVSHSILSRATSRGSLDTTFNNNLGFVEVITSGGEDFVTSSIAVDRMNRIIVCGHTVDIRANTFGLCVRYSPDGVRDMTFAGTGEHRVPNRTYSDVRQSDNALTFCGSTPQGAMLYRTTLDGLPDMKFNNGQPVINTQVTSWDKLVLTGQKILAIGTIDDVFGGKAMLARFNANGTPDLTFGDGTGSVALNHDAQAVTAVDVAVDLQGRILVLIRLEYSVGPDEYVLTRYLP